MGFEINSERTGKELLNASLAGMFNSKVDEKTQELFSGRRGPSTKKVRVAHATPTEKACEAALAEIAAEKVEKPMVLKEPREATFYKVTMRDLQNGALRVHSRYFGEEILVPKALVEFIAADKTDFEFTGDLKVKVVVKEGKPRLKAVAIEIDKKQWSLEDAEAWVVKHTPEAPKEVSKTTKFKTGTLKWFDPERGFGFVIPDDGGKDVFLHISVVIRMIGECGTLADDTKLSYKIGKNPKTGRMAVTAFKILKES